MRQRGVFLVVTLVVFLTESCICMLIQKSKVPAAFPLGKIGCQYDGEVCDKDEVCIHDNLFGTCQTSDTLKFDLYQYTPNERSLRVIISELHRLINDDYTWHDGYTQCVLQHIIVSSRQNSVYDPRICEEGLIVSKKIDELDDNIYSLVDDILKDESVLETVYDPSNKRDELIRVHKYNVDSPSKIKKLDTTFSDTSLQDIEPSSKLMRSYNVLNKLSTSDLLLLRAYLKSLLLHDNKSNQPVDKIDLTDIAPTMTPRYSNIITDLLQQNLDAEDLNDKDLHIVSEILSEMVQNIQKKFNSAPVITDDVSRLRTSKPSGNADLEKLAKILDGRDDLGTNDIPDTSDIDDVSEPTAEISDAKTENDIDHESLVNKLFDEHMKNDEDVAKEDIHLKHIDSDHLLEKKGGYDLHHKTSKISDLDIEESPEGADLVTTEGSSTPSTSSDSLKTVDFNYAYIDLKDRVDIQDAALLVRMLERIVGIPIGSLELDQIENNIITVHVPSESIDVTAQTIASASVENKEAIQKKLGLTVVSSGFGTKIARVKLEELSHHHRYFVLTFVLCGTVAFILVSVVVIYLVRRHSRSKQKLARLSGNGDPVEASNDYKDLCRQRMQAKSSEKPEPINAASRISSVSESQVRSPSSRSSTSSWSEEPVVTNMDISTGHIVLSYMESHLKNKDRLDEEWHTLSAYEADPSSSKVAQDPANVRKNRYADVLPYDHSRVVLTDASNITQSDYINASTITDHDPRNPAYIATQGPLPHTVADFWQMVWEQGSAVVVMLTRLNENGSTVCHRYWPEEGSDLYHIYEVHLVSEHIWCDDYLVRSFYLKNVETNETRTVTQFHFLTWTDMKTVPTIKALLDFRRKVNKSYRGRSCPVVVHCSDGSGRTGTYCLVDMVLNRLAKGAKEIDIAATLEHIRDQRMAMVKSKEQFEFALACVAEEVHAILKALPQ